VLIINKGKKIVIDTPENLSKRMGGSTGVEMKIKGEEGIIKKLLSNLDGVTDVSINKGRREEGCVYLTVYSNNDNQNELSETIFYTLAENKCPILEMKPAAMSLEEVFLEVTKDDTKYTSKRKRRLLESEPKAEAKKKAETQTEEAEIEEKIETKTEIETEKEEA
jgi:ABC-2 type transport system ATP-binding protein